LTPDNFDWNRVPDDEVCTFTWKHARRSLAELEYFVLDRGAAVFMVKYAEWDAAPTEGWGYYRNKFTFLLNTLKIIQEWATVGVTKTFDYRSLTFVEPKK
jgi:hypothetical protein